MSRWPLKIAEDASKVVEAYSDPCLADWGVEAQGFVPSLNQCKVDCSLAQQRISEAELMVIPNGAKIFALLLGIGTGLYFALR